MRGIGKYILTFLMVGGVVLFSGTVTRVSAGTCNFEVGTSYSESSCQGARDSATGVDCGSGGYSYYSCNYDGGENQWEYCYGCHVLGPGETPQPTTKPPAQCNGDYIVNCLAGQTKTSLPLNTYCLWGGEARACSDGRQNYYVGSAQAVTGQCHRIPDPDNPENTIFDGVNVTTYSCCPAGTIGVTNPGEYYDVNYIDRCDLPEESMWISSVCSRNDTYISRVQDINLGQCDWSYNNCDENGENCDRSPIYYRRVTCQRTIYSCVLACSSADNVAPTPPTQIMPDDGAVINDTTVTLGWGVPNWGAACTQNNQYFLRLSESADLSGPNIDNWIPEGTNSFTFSGLSRGKTYYWAVASTNGALDSNAGGNPVRSFRIPAQNYRST